jgi:hypothetical protein
MHLCDGSYAQKWGYSDNGRLRAHPRFPGNNTGYCLYFPDLDDPGYAVRATTGACGGGWDAQSTMSPDASVGAGSVGDIGDVVVDDQAYQWVNYEEFGRCFDITNWNVNFAYMIAYPCKQNPIQQVGWNHILYWDADDTRQLYARTGNNGTPYTSLPANAPRYCVEAPAPSASQPYYVQMRTCSTSVTGQQWTITRDTGFYGTSYLVIDGYGRCMAAVNGHPVTSTYVTQFSRIAVETCNGSDRQKWNAPPGQREATVRDTSELP